MNIDRVLEVIETEFKGKAFNSDGQCMYLTNDCKKCMIGMFIPDGHEAQYYTGIAACLIESFPDLKEYMPTDDESILSQLQQVHDESWEYSIDKYTDYLDLPEQITYLQLQALRILGE